MNYKKIYDEIIQKAKDRNKVKCIYCDKYMDIGNYNRWHGNNCRLK
ncbi:MAG: hypothetical protein PHF86_01980 [Candidatus Nanoarchaeia archaeon]|nr:hypothetical protein [Candidatus Nanoarchaeia archaeon]